MDDLAKIQSRFGAYLIDCLVIVLPILVVIPFENTSSGPIFMGIAGLVFFGIAIFQLVLLSKHGQTIGKKLLNIKIVKRDTRENGGFVTNVVLRGLVSGLISIIPFYSLIDTLFIFSQERRCIHDLIAGTIVVHTLPNALDDRICQESIQG